MDRLTRWNDRTEMAELEDWDTEEEWKDFMGSLDVPEQIGLGTAIDKLAEYEDAEEQGLLLRLPCKVGDDVYYIPSEVNYRLNMLHGRNDLNKVGHQKIESITIKKDVWFVELALDKEYGTGNIRVDVCFGKTWFLAREEAEKALRERGPFW